MTRRLLATYLTLTLFVLVVLEVPFGITVARRERDRLTTQVERDAVVLASLAEDALDQGLDLDARPIRRYAEQSGSRVVLVDGRGTEVLDTAAAAEARPRTYATRPEIIRALGGRVSTGTRASETLGTDLFYVAVPVASGGTVHGALRVTYSASEVEDRVRRSWLTLAAVGAVALVGAAVVGVALARSVTRPLRRLEAAAEALGAGDLSARAAGAGGPPEVQALAATFDDMAARLEELVASQEAFVADASHQLRNPLTSLRLRIENLAATTGSDAEAALDEVGRLSRIMDGLLVLARADREAADREVVPVDAGSLLRARRDEWEPLASERDVGLRVEAGDPDLRLLATPERVRQVLDNLLANALEAAPPGTDVRLAADAENGHVVLHVIDDGPGLPAEERERAFDRFWRSHPARQGSLGGHGLGLPIVRKLVGADRGSVVLAESDSGGIDAQVRYRAADAGVRTASR